MILENGQRYEGDLLVGADGIWSKVYSRFQVSFSLYSYISSSAIRSFVFFFMSLVEVNV